MGLKGKGLGGKSKGAKCIRSFILRTYIVGGMGVKELYIDCGNGGASFHWRYVTIPT